jgi:hypothetical protein
MGPRVPRYRRGTAVSTSSFEICGGRSENVTVLEVEICAEMSPVSICERTNVRHDKKTRNRGVA